MPAHRRFKAPAPTEAVSHFTPHHGAGGEDKVPVRRCPIERGSLIGICQGSVDRRGSEEYSQRKGTGSASESWWSCRITMRCSGPGKGMRSAPRARRNILRPRRAVKVSGRPLIAVVMPHELQEQQCIGSGKVIALGGVDSRRPTAATIAGRNLRARTPGRVLKRRYLTSGRPS